jgi:hypothetical protein
VRQRAKPALRAVVHDSDVNVMSWNRMAPAMLASGADDGCFRIWDLRHFAAGGFVANFSYHTAPVTSIEWSLFDSSTLATASADHQAAVWDLAVERDAEEEAAAMTDTHNALPPAELPPQLMFVHQGQRDVKELHWHPQVPGLVVTTAANGFQVWKPENQARRGFAPGSAAGEAGQTDACLVCAFLLRRAARRRRRCCSSRSEHPAAARAAACLHRVLRTHSCEPTPPRVCVCTA